LERRFGPAVETAFSRRLLERLEAGLRRVAAADERGELQRVAPARSRDDGNEYRTIGEILGSRLSGRRLE
jgi:hypothetical protein